LDGSWEGAGGGLAAAGGGGGCAGGALGAQLGAAGAAPAPASPLLAAAAAAAAGAGGGGTLLPPSGALTVTVAARAARAGVWPLGALRVLAECPPGGGEAARVWLSLPLPAIAVHAPPLTADLVFFAPAAAAAAAAAPEGAPPTLTVALRNETGHFQGLEVGAFLPGTLSAGAGGGGGAWGALAAAPAPAAALQALPALGSPQPLGATQLELLPGAARSVAFALPVPRALAGYAGPIALPTVTVRAVEGANALAAPPPQAQAQAGAAAVEPEVAVPLERRTLLAALGTAVRLRA